MRAPKSIFYKYLIRLIQTTSPCLAEKSLSSRRNPLRNVGFPPTCAVPNWYCERPEWGMKSGSRRQG